MRAVFSLAAVVGLLVGPACHSHDVRLAYSGASGLAVDVEAVSPEAHAKLQRAGDVLLQTEAAINEAKPLEAASLLAQGTAEFSGDVEAFSPSMQC